MFLLLFFMLLSSGVIAQEAEQVDIYGLGDQTFSISAGTILPLFIHGVDGVFSPGFQKLSLGAAGSLRWGTFLTNELTLGIDLGGMFSFTLLDRTLVMLPVTGVVSYAIRLYPFEILLHGGVGINFTKLESDLYAGPVLKPGVSFLWNYNGEWSFGLQTEYWWVPEFYFGNTVPANHSSFANFLGITLTTLYHF